METYSPKPGQVIQVIKALADSTRRHILLLLHENAPKGLTASVLADNLGKKIPTILHHLEKLKDLDLAYFTMEKMGGGDRQVKHWKVKHLKFAIEVDFDSISIESFTPEKQLKYIFSLFEEEKAAKKAISEDFAIINQPGDILERLNNKFPEISQREAEVIHSQLSDNKGLIQYLQKWIYQEFLDSGGALQLDFFEFGLQFALNDTLRRNLFEDLVNSQNFTLYTYTDDGRVIQRLALHSEYLEAHRNP
ncbi:MAG: ArsR/SmtB family transcription factor [Candidatus Hodarchaeales archaeon]